MGLFTPNHDAKANRPQVSTLGLVTSSIPRDLCEGREPGRRWQKMPTLISDADPLKNICESSLG